MAAFAPYVLGLTHKDPAQRRRPLLASKPSAALILAGAFASRRHRAFRRANLWNSKLSEAVNAALFERSM